MNERTNSCTRLKADPIPTALKKTEQIGTDAESSCQTLVRSLHSSNNRQPPTQGNQTMKKYELMMDDSVEFLTTDNYYKLYRVRALRDFGNVKCGDIGGYVESEANLSHQGNAWVGAAAQVYDNASISDDAIVYGWAKIFGNARICGDAMIDYGEVSGSTVVSCRAKPRIDNRPPPDHSHP